MNIKLLSELLSINSYSGYEFIMLSYIQDYALKINEKLKIKRENEWLEISNSTNNSKDIIFVIHVDEVGFQLIEKKDHQYLLNPIGSPINITYLGAIAVVEDIVGLVSIKSEVDLYGNDLIPLNLYFKTSFKSKELNKKPLYFKNQFNVNDKEVIGKGLDNKVGIYLALEILPTIIKSNLNITLLFTTQEEIRNCKYPDFLFDSKNLICIDAFSTIEDDCHSGGGSVISFSPNYSLSKSQKFINELNKEKISYQLSLVNNKTGTEIDIISNDIRNKNIPYIIFSYPTSFMHSLNEVVLVNDINCVYNSLISYIENI